MSIYEHVTEFAGLPVLAYDPAGPVPADPGAVAWRVDTDYDGGTELFSTRLTALVSSPWAGQIRALIIGAWGEHDTLAPVDRLCQAAPQLTGLRAIFLGELTSEENEISWIQQDDVTPLLTSYPALETLRVRGSDGLDFQPIRHEKLRELAFESGGLPATIVRAAGEADLPALRHLELWLGTEAYGGDATVDDLAGVLAAGRLPSLIHLGLRDSEIADEVAAAIAGAPVVARLETLDLSMGALSDVGAAALLAGQPLTHLRKLDLHYHYLSEAMMDRLRAEFGEIVDCSDPNGDKDADSRFIAVSE